MTRPEGETQGDAPRDAEPEAQRDAQRDALDVAYVAHLARLDLTPEEVTTFQRQLSQIVAYVQAIRSVDVEGVAPACHAHPVENVFRADEPVASLPIERVLGHAPARRDGLFIVPKIVE